MNSEPAWVLTPETDDIIQTLDFLHQPGTVFEVCLINPQIKKHRAWNNEFAAGKKPIIAGWFNDPVMAAEIIGELNEPAKPDGVYVTLNQCNPALLGRANSRLKANVARTTDKDITRLCHLLIDVDPERPAAVSSSDDEKAAAKAVLEAVFDYLKDNGWPEPLRGDSGNGYHLIYRLALENNPENIALIKAALQALDALFSNDQAKVDVSVFNPARISKVYGTTARKGDSTHDRPHRQAAILSIPEAPQPVPVKLLQALATEAPASQHQAPAHNSQINTSSRLNVEAYLSEHGITVKQIKTHGNSTLYVLEQCLFDETHTGGEAAIGQTADGKLFYQCFHNSCKGRKWQDARQVISGDNRLFPAVQNGTILPWPEIVPLPEAGNTGKAADYDLELLPGAIRDTAGEVARFAKVPVVSPAIVGLSVIAAAIGKKARVIERPGLEHHPSLFFALIAASGERKSPIFKKITVPFETWAIDQLEHYEELQREAKASNIVTDAAISGVRGRAKADDVDLEAITRDISKLEARRIKEPPFPSLFTTDTTEQRLFQKMHDRAGAYAVMSGEGRPVIDAILGKYSGDGTGDALYLAGISGDTITRDRVGRDAGPEERIIRDPCLNVCVYIQPDKYQEASTCPALRASGALARIWPVHLPSLVGDRMEARHEPGLNDAVMQKFYDLVSKILRTSPPKNESTGIDCHKAKLSDEAAEARRVYHNTIEALMAEGEDLEDVRDIASKAVSQTVKLALVLHLAEQPALLQEPTSTINLDTWAKAQALGTYHLQEAVRVQRMADEDKDTSQARRLLEWIKRENLKEVTGAVLMQNGPRPRMKAAEARTLLELLSDYGYLAPQKRPERRKPVYLVNPLISQISQNSRGSHGK